MIRARALAVLAVALIVAALTLAACRGDDGETTTAPTPTEALGSGGAAPSLSKFPPEFVDCLADQGIDVEAVDDLSEAIHSPAGQQCFGLLHGG